MKEGESCFLSVAEIPRDRMEAIKLMYPGKNPVDKQQLLPKEDEGGRVWLSKHIPGEDSIISYLSTSHIYSFNLKHYYI